MNWLRDYRVLWLEFLGWSCFDLRSVKVYEQPPSRYIKRVDMNYYFEHKNTSAEKVVRFKGKKCHSNSY